MVVQLGTAEFRNFGPIVAETILDCRGFDSSIILIIRGGILMSIGNFPEIQSQRILRGTILVGRLGGAWKTGVRCLPRGLFHARGMLPFQQPTFQPFTNIQWLSPSLFNRSSSFQVNLWNVTLFNFVIDCCECWFRYKLSKWLLAHPLTHHYDYCYY